MKQILVCSIAFLTGISCNNVTDKEENANSNIQQLTDTPLSAVLPAEEGNSKWLNDLVFDYIRNSNQELIKLSLQDSSIEEVWIDQGMNERNGSTYYMCQIGHHIAEEDGSEPRFATDGWVYVDSAKRILYEYDLPNDSLILWKR